MKNQYNIWNKWDKLKTVVLGDIYNKEFYKDIKSKDTRDCFYRITEETKEDLENFSNVLKDFGCTVLRPEIDPNDNIMNHVDQKGRMNMGRGGVPKPPLFPRDAQLVSGNSIVYTSIEPGDPWGKILREYNNKDVVDLRIDGISGRRLDGFKKSGGVIHAPQYTMVGRDLYIDTNDRPIRQWQQEELLKAVKDIRLNYLRIGGHNDGCFHTLKPGVIISLEDIQFYDKTFPDWDLLYLPEQSWEKVNGFLKMKKKVQGKWWVPGEEDNDEFTMFVESWLNGWVGYTEETVFDVNCLVLDEHHVCVNNMNPKVIAYLKKHKMEPVHVPWRHRYFFDGGLHCLTLDLYREGHMTDYFPERGDVGITDLGV
jgi:hypothetical protein|tara:strand:+ start:12209 stop:13312 length:1104 start_codon:yes stop_codon:yes gene_type:complete